MSMRYGSESLESGGKERRSVELLKTLSKDKTYLLELVLMSHEIHHKEIFELGINIHYAIRRTKKILELFHICIRYAVRLNRILFIAGVQCLLSTEYISPNYVG